MIRPCREMLTVSATPLDSSSGSFLVRCGLVLELLYHWSKFFECGGVLRAELLRRATRIGVLHRVEHCAC